MGRESQQAIRVWVEAHPAPLALTLAPGRQPADYWLNMRIHAGVAMCGVPHARLAELPQLMHWRQPRTRPWTRYRLPPRHHGSRHAAIGAKTPASGVRQLTHPPQETRPALRNVRRRRRDASLRPQGQRLPVGAGVFSYLAWL